MADQSTSAERTDSSYRIGEAEAIVREIVAVMVFSLLVAGKKLLPGALDDWRQRLLEHVEKQLEHGDWEKARPTVLAVAADMAAIAGMLSYKGDVDKERVDAAFIAIKSHKRCPSGVEARTLGCWCDCP